MIRDTCFIGLSLIWAAVACGRTHLVEAVDAGNAGGTVHTGSSGFAGSGGVRGTGGLPGQGGSTRAGGTGGLVIILSTIPSSSPTTLFSCGDGILEATEACDDGNTTSYDGCTADCQVEDGFACPDPGRPCQSQNVCGNGILAADETCDDGNTRAGDGCSEDCRSVETGWRCLVSGRLCSPVCGDGLLLGSEQCDDGNVLSGDGCSRFCRVEPGYTCSKPGGACAVFTTCGNGKIDPGEVCDLGVNNGVMKGDGTGCTKSCTKEPTCYGETGKVVPCTGKCGDGYQDPEEECDFGTNPNASVSNNDTRYGGCTTTCRLGPYCGDAIVTSPWEECDQGANNGSVYGVGGCALGCRWSHYCGDGIVDPTQGEQCDYGPYNGHPGQPCTLACHYILP